MHLTALVEREDHVCCRYRLAAFRPALAHAGHHLEFRPWPRHWWHWWRLGRELAHTDVVIWQRRLLTPCQLYILRRASRRLVFDVDDAVFLRDSYSSRGLHSCRRLRSFGSIIRTVDAVVAGNSFLAEQANFWHPRGQVLVIPTCVDLGRYQLHQPGKPAATGKIYPRQQWNVHLVWIGSSSTLQGLEAIKPLLEEVGRQIRGLNLKLICDRFFSLQHLTVLPCPWSEASEGPELAQADIGISWIPDDLWSRGKCGLKVLQYMAAGLPVVANAVGVQADLVVHGETGFLANSTPQWVEAIGRLANDPALRRRLGQNGRQRAERSFGLKAGADAWIALLATLGEPNRLAA